MSNDGVVVAAPRVGGRARGDGEPVCLVGPTMMVSPAEPPELKKLGAVSALPERHGVDFAWIAHDQLHGAQRKTITDLIASATVGDRLTREMGQMQGLSTRVLIV